MTTLSKEDVISSLQAALEKQSGKVVNIEQSGSWYKIDDGKSVRFSELETMLAELEGDRKAQTKAVTKAKTVNKKTTKAAKVKTASAANGSSGLTPKEMWRAKLAKTSGKHTLPRGF